MAADVDEADAQLPAERGDGRQDVGARAAANRDAVSSRMRNCYNVKEERESARRGEEQTEELVGARISGASSARLTGARNSVNGTTVQKARLTLKISNC